jgi:hypothetical protein
MYKYCSTTISYYVLLKVVLFWGGLVPSIEPLKKYWVSKAMVLGMGLAMQEEAIPYLPNNTMMAEDTQYFWSGSTRGTTNSHEE